MPAPYCGDPENCEPNTGLKDGEQNPSTYQAVVAKRRVVASGDRLLSVLRDSITSNL
ncbi:MAG: hypothetical protein J1F67_11310 [Muribaculaceae bacterium]|nr:hypothetical protein [Muribaculaceae bacterium]